MNDHLKKYRRRFRAWRNRKRLEKENVHYERIFNERGLKVPDEEAIRSAIRKKFRIEPKPKGALNILAIYHHYNWENTSLKPALEKFGTVRVYDWADEFDHQKEGWLEVRRAEMNRVLVERVERWSRERPIDVIFAYVSGELVTPETVRELRRFAIPMISMSLNDKEGFVGKIRREGAQGMRDICRHFDLCWTSTEDALKKYCVEGAMPIYLPEGANPDLHRPYEIEKTIDVSFVGQCYGDRPEVIRRLRERGVRVEACGYGWPQGPLSVEEMVRMYSKSRVNLGFGGVYGYRDTYCLKGRDFEIPMSGGLYLTEYHPELERFFKPGEEIMTYAGFEDLVGKIRFLLSNPQEADRIRERGFHRARREHSWEKRFEKIFTLMGLLM